MCFGEATIVSDVTGSGMGLVIDDGETGLLVPPADAPELAESLRNLDKNHDKLPQSGEGRKHPTTFFILLSHPLS